MELERAPTQEKRQSLREQLFPLHLGRRSPSNDPSSPSWWIL